jgi:hypothetical protein
MALSRSSTRSLRAMFSLLTFFVRGTHGCAKKSDPIDLAVVISGQHCRCGGRIRSYWRASPPAAHSWPRNTDDSSYKQKNSPQTRVFQQLHLFIGTLGALVADQQVLAEIESGEYSLITSSLNTRHSCWVLSQFGDFSIL